MEIKVTRKEKDRRQREDSTQPFLERSCVVLDPGSTPAAPSRGSDRCPSSPSPLPGLVDRVLDGRKEGSGETSSSFFLAQHAHVNVGGEARQAVPVLVRLWLDLCPTRGLDALPAIPYLWAALVA